MNLLCANSVHTCSNAHEVRLLFKGQIRAYQQKLCNLIIMVDIQKDKIFNGYFNSSVSDQNH